MIDQVTVEQLYALPGFEDMIAEYAKHAIKDMPKPLYQKEDYLPLEKAGVLTVWCAMYGGLVVGFATCLLSKIPHYGVNIAIAESVFVRKHVRRLGLGIRFLRTIELYALNNDIPVVFASCPMGSDYEKVLIHRGYSAETTTYVKVFPCSQLV